MIRSGRARSTFIVIGDRLMDENKHTPKGVKKLVEMITKLEPQEFLGVCKLLGVRLYDEVAPVKESDENLEGRETSKLPTKEELMERNSDIVMRPAEILFEEVVTELCSMNRVRRRNLEKLLRPATRGR